MRQWHVEQVGVEDGGIFGKANEDALLRRLEKLHDSGWTILSVAAGCGHTSMRLITAYRDIPVQNASGGL